VGDIGPDTRIIRIDPVLNTVSTWADDGQWTDGGFGTGGMVYNQKDGFYVAHGGSLWFVPLLSDGSAGTASVVTLTGTQAADGSSAINADGMVWAGGNTIFYAENDAFVPGFNGIIHRVELQDSLNGTNERFEERLNDPSGVFFADETLYVAESQFGVALGINFVPTSNPFCIKPYEVNDIPLSTKEIITPQKVLLSPNPAADVVRISSPQGSLKSIALYDLTGRIVETGEVNGPQAHITLADLPEGMYWVKGEWEIGGTFMQPLLVK